MWLNSSVFTAFMFSFVSDFQSSTICSAIHWFGPYVERLTISTQSYEDPHSSYIRLVSGCTFPLLPLHLLPIPSPCPQSPECDIAHDIRATNMAFSSRFSFWEQKGGVVFAITQIDMAWCVYIHVPLTN